MNRRDFISKAVACLFSPCPLEPTITRFGHGFLIEIGVVVCGVAREKDGSWQLEVSVFESRGKWNGGLMHRKLVPTWQLKEALVGLGLAVEYNDDLYPLLVCRLQELSESDLLDNLKSILATHDQRELIFDPNPEEWRDFNIPITFAHS